MGIYTDVATGSSTITPAKPRVGLDRSSAEQLLSRAARHDPALRAALATTGDEVQTLSEYVVDPTGGDFTLTIKAHGNVAFTTAAIAYNAAAATIESAIDTAATGVVAGWTNGDITVAAAVTDLTDGNVTLTYDGTSVNDRGHELVVFDGSGLTGGDTDTVVTKTTSGNNGSREVIQILEEMNVVSGTTPGQGEAPSWTRPASVGQSRARYGLIVDLAKQSVIDEGSELVHDAVLALYPRS